jgi:putative Mg2+ transporter-C (MgtC) family protein
MIDRQPAREGSEVVTVYTFRAVCREPDEAHIRALVVQALTRDDFVIRAVRSENLDSGSGQVEVEAELQSLGRDDVALEGAVSRLSLEPSVASVSWNVMEEAEMVLAAED